MNKVILFLFMVWSTPLLAQQNTGKSAYLFTYFTGKGTDAESIRFATSKDGYNFKALNNNMPVLSSAQISSMGGVRDPHILRGEDGKTFYMVATDMNVAKNGWNPNHAMVLLKSKDLMNWTSHIVNIPALFPELSAVTKVWAPQTIFDAKKGKYMIYWSMSFGKDPIKIYYAYAKSDFSGLETKPKQLFFSPDNTSCLDGDIIFKDGKYHLFMKATGKMPGIKQAVSNQLTEGYVLIDKRLEQTEQDVEGSGVFKLNNSDTWILMYDLYRTGKYQFTKSKDLENFSAIDNEVSMDFLPRHGTIIAITSKEEQALRHKWELKSNKPKSAAVINVDLNGEIAPMKPIWAWFGYDEPNYTYMKDGKKLLSEIAALSPVPVYVRAHNLLTSGDGTPALKWGSTNIYTEDEQGNPVYNYKIVDSIFDTYIKRGMKPLAQIGFMPEALSIHPQPYQHQWKPGMSYNTIETGWAYPPKDYGKWAELVYQWVKHCVSRYGKEEVESWYWEVWNEANGAYWKGTQAEFFKLYDYAADGLKRALPTAKIGGPNVTGGGMKYLDAFIRHCLRDTNYATGKIGAPLDIVLFHAKGSPRVMNGNVVMNVKQQLRNIADNFKVIGAYPELKGIPIILGESDPEGCAACGMSTNPENAYRNGTMYSSYTAASFARKYLLADLYDKNLIGAVSWSFEFEDQPWFAGFRDLATNGVDKPVLNVFRMYGMMKGKRVKAESNRMYPIKSVLDSSIRSDQTDIGALASKAANTAGVMVWNYHDEDVVGPSESVTINIAGIPGRTFSFTEYRIDDKHSNAYALWKKMGSPQNPTAAQIAQLEKGGQLQTIGKTLKGTAVDGNFTVNISLPRQGVSLLKLDW
jgi:xylan 1,4-beta-xylosidase